MCGKKLYKFAREKNLIYDYAIGFQSVLCGPNGSATSSEIHDYISVVDTLKFTFFLIKRKKFWLKRETSLIGDVFIACVIVTVSKKPHVPTK